MPYKYDNIVLTTHNNYLHTILQKSQKYLEQTFNKNELIEFHERIKPIYELNDTKEIVRMFEKIYYEFIKECYQSHYKHNKNLESKDSIISFLRKDCHALFCAYTNRKFKRYFAAYS